MKRLIVIAILVINGEIFWAPCDRGGVFCPHFNVEAVSEEQVKGDVVYVAYEPAPSTVVPEVNE